MSGRSLAKLFGYSEGSISNFLNGKASPRRARREKILNYMDNCFVLPTAYNKIASPPVVEKKTERNRGNYVVEGKPFKATIASVLESASLFGTVTITDKNGVYRVTKLEGQPMTDTTRLLALEKIRTELERTLAQAYFVFSKTDKPEFKTLAEGQNWYAQHNYIAEKMVGSWVDNTMCILDKLDTKKD